VECSLETPTISAPSGRGPERAVGAAGQSIRGALAKPRGRMWRAQAVLVPPVPGFADAAVGNGTDTQAGGKLAALCVLVVVFLVNLGQTGLEGTWSPGVTARSLEFASALHWLEGRAALENHDVTNAIAVYGYSAAYFILFPILVALVGCALVRRPDPRPFRTYAFALAADYAISLPFFLLFPVPERWAYPDAGAILLSDLWDSRLIEAFRPMSALDNCFPSFHTSMTVVLVLCAFLHRLRFRVVLIPLGVMVVLSTYALGVHWIGDVVTGAAVGCASVSAACRLTDRRPPGAERVRAH
jgi:membrane-associated phospholipid phosphatase